MGNLLRLIVELAEDEATRATFLDDPDAALTTFGDLCGEDVAAAIDVARVQVAPSIAERLTDTLAMSSGEGETPRDVAVRALLSLCESLGSATVVDFLDASHRREPDAGPHDDVHEVPDHPPGLDRPVHLWAVGTSENGGADDDQPGLGAPTSVPLSPVPDPPGGFEFGVLELVSLPDGLSDHGIEPGAQATVVAVHREPELSYEIEISDDDGSRRFLGVVPTTAVGPAR